MVCSVLDQPQAVESRMVDSSRNISLSGAEHYEQIESGWIEVIHSLRSLARLSDDWDGFGAKSPPLDVVSASIKLARHLQMRDCELPASATATPAGTILFEWHDAGTYVEMEVVSQVMVEWMIVDHTSVTTHGTITL